MPDSTSFDSLRQRLDECHDFPCSFVFKFIVPKDKTSEMEGLLAGFPYSSRDSKTGKYVSYTADLEMASSEDVVRFYQAAAHIEGLIAL